MIFCAVSPNLSNLANELLTMEAQVCIFLLLMPVIAAPLEAIAVLGMYDS